MSLSPLSSSYKGARCDIPMLLCSLLLLGLGILVVFSTTAITSQELYGKPSALMMRHVIHIVLGMVLLGFTFAISTERLLRSAPILLGIATAMLLFVLIPGLGHTAGGAQRWFALGPLRLQPGELAKLAAVIFFAQYIHLNQMRMQNLKFGALIPFAFVCVISALLLLEPDFGSTAIILAVVFTQLMLVTPIRYLMTVGIVAVLSCAGLVIASPYRLKRFEAFLNPAADKSASGYQLMQSLIAVGSGGVWGAGLGAGKQKLYYLPAAHTDFIFAVIAEELGLVGALFVLTLFAVIFYRGLLLAYRLREDCFRCALAVGLTLLLTLPGFLNMGVVLGLLPTKGLVLPFVAYGGSAMLMHLAALGILLRLSADVNESALTRVSH